MSEYAENMGYNLQLYLLIFRMERCRMTLRKKNRKKNIPLSISKRKIQRKTFINNSQQF